MSTKAEKQNQKSLKRRVLKEEHKCWLEQEIEKIPNKRWTWHDVKSSLHSQFPELVNISESTISRFLRNRLGYSYKKLERKPAPSLRSDAIRKLYEGALIQQIISDEEIEMIFIDEFSVNTRHHYFRGWAKRDAKGYIKTDQHDFAMSFVWGVSSKSVYGLMGAESTITSSELMFYIKTLSEKREDLVNHNNTDFIFVYDNARIHTSKAVQDFILKSKLRSISIPPYTPILNPCEKLINSIKMKLKRMHSWGR